MRVSDLLSVMLVVSAISLGIGGFMADVAGHYALSSQGISAVSNTYNVYSNVDGYMKDIHEKMTKLNGLNPLTWGNVVVIVVNIFLVFLSIPSLFHTIIADTLIFTGILPSWFAYTLEGALLIVVLIGVLNAINKWRS